MKSKKKETFRRLLISAIAVLLCLTAIQISGMSENKISIENSIINLGTSHTMRKTRQRSISSVTSQIISASDCQVLSISGNAPILMSDYDCQNPAIAADGDLLNNLWY